MAVSDFSEDEFTVGEDGLPEYTGDGYDTRLGIDVSFYQGEIDWQAVADSGIEFAMIPVSYTHLECRAAFAALRENCMRCSILA